MKTQLPGPSGAVRIVKFQEEKNNTILGLLYCRGKIFF
jgi:hypothetical protein